MQYFYFVLGIFLSFVVGRLHKSKLRFPFATSLPSDRVEELTRRIHLHLGILAGGFLTLGGLSCFMARDHWGMLGVGFFVARIFSIAYEITYNIGSSYKQ